MINEATFPRLDLREAATVPPPPEEFVFADFPFDVGLYGMLIGPDGARKSWVALHIAIGVAAGLSIAGGLWPAPHSGRVVYYAGEDPRRQLRNRYWAIAHQPGYENISDLDDRLDVVPVLDMPEGIALLNQTRDGIERTSWDRDVLISSARHGCGGVNEIAEEVGRTPRRVRQIQDQIWAWATKHLNPVDLAARLDDPITRETAARRPPSRAGRKPKGWVSAQAAQAQRPQVDIFGEVVEWAPRKPRRKAATGMRRVRPVPVVQGGQMELFQEAA